MEMSYMVLFAGYLLDRRARTEEQQLLLELWDMSGRKVSCTVEFGVPSCQGPWEIS